MATLKRRVIGTRSNGLNVNGLRKAMFNASTWTPKKDDEGNELHIPLAECLEAMGISANDIEGNVGEIQVTEFENGDLSPRLVVPLMDGDAYELRLSSQSELNEGDEVDLSTVYAIILHKRGEEDIYRFDGEKA